MIKKRISKIPGLFNRAGKGFSLWRHHTRIESFRVIFETFQKILAANNQMLSLIAEMGDKLSGDYIFDTQYIRSACRESADLIQAMINGLNTIAPGKYNSLNHAFQKIYLKITEELAGRPVIPKGDFVIPFHLINTDIESVVGGKNANLGEVKNLLELPVPEGFSITTRAFDLFMTHNHFRDKIKSITDAWREDRMTVENASKQIQEMILAGDVPDLLKKSMFKALDRLYGCRGATKPFLAVRSSAWGEDGNYSFAGQYLSLLNEPPDNLVNAYTQVIAGGYSASAMEYRRLKEFSENEVVMAVGCQLMIDPAASGVLYTFNPQTPDRDVMLISSVWGLGAPIVDGSTASDRFEVERRYPHTITVLEVALKRKTLGPAPAGGTQLSDVPEDQQNLPSLTEKQLKELIKTALKIERHFKKPQDIEFAFDREGKLFILQTRPLNIKINRDSMIRDLPDILNRHPILFGDRGTIAQRGIAIGKVYKVFKDEDLNVFPEGAILVAKHISPRFAKVIRKASAIITDVGSATGHMATIAREFRIPTIVNTGIATEILSSRQKITVDAEENKVYDGFIKELRNYHLSEDPIEETPEYRLLRRVLKKIGPLNLLDPTKENFTPSGCRTFHDITRFVHEKAVEELINMHYYHHHAPKTVTGKLKLSVPIDLVLIDIGEGLEKDTQSSVITLKEIASFPMKAFAEGLTFPGAWNNDPMPVDMGSFMSSMTRTFSTNLANPRAIGQNLGVISKCYANISLRLGYHFNMIDAYIDDTHNLNNNHIYFRFLGGVTDIAKRSRRARLLAEILGKQDFQVDIKGDLVVGRTKKLTTDRMLQKIFILGVLVGFSRQLDVQMASDQQIHQYAEKFEQLITSNKTKDGNEGSHYET